MRVLELPAGKSPREWGRIHGESFRGEIRGLVQLRVYLCTKVGSFVGRDQVLSAAKAHLPVLERYCKPLYEELIGIAEGAIVSPEEIVVANHYTDLRDLDPDPVAGREVVRGGDAADPDPVDLAGHKPGRLLEAAAVAEPQAAVGEVVGGPVRIDVHELDEDIRVLDVG